MLRLITFCCAFVAVHLSFAQIQSDSLKELLVQGNRLEKFAVGAKVIKLDSLVMKHHQFQSLADVLSQQSSVYIKNYGPANISSLGFRGTGASQTALIWNGFNLQSSFLGQNDISLFPLAVIDEVQIQHGGASTLYGSGSIGGAIYLNSPMPKFCPQLKFGLGHTRASFGNEQYIFTTQGGNKHFQTKIKLLYREGVNNFPFRNSSGDILKQSNAQVSQWNIISENFWKINPSNTLSLMAWLQSSSRNLPSTSTGTNNLGFQKDNALRLCSEWKSSFNKFDFSLRSALLNEQLDYSSFISSSTSANSFIPEAEISYRPHPNHLLNMGFNHTWQQVNSTNYGQIHHISRYSVFANYKFQNRRRNVAFSTSIRKGWISKFANAPLIPMIGLEFKILGNLKFQYNFSGNYRIPTLNDLFWNLGREVGNSNLLPERSWSHDCGVNYAKSIYIAEQRLLKVGLSVNYFNNIIYQSIQWQINSDARWSPTNLPEVWTRGLECNGSVAFKTTDWLLKLQINTNYVVATNEKAMFSNDQSYKKQLIFTPIYNHQANFNVAYKKLDCNFNITYTGYRYTTSDNYKALEPYLLLNIQLNYKLYLHRYWPTTFFAQINNVSNKSYQVIENYPMPGINAQLGFLMNYNKMFNQ